MQESILPGVPAMAAPQPGTLIPVTNLAPPAQPLAVGGEQQLVAGAIVRRIDNANNGRFYERDGVYRKSVTSKLDEAYPLTYGLKEHLLTHSKQENQDILEQTGLSGSKVHHTVTLILSGREVATTGITKEQCDFLGLVDKKLRRYLMEPYTKEEDKKLRGFHQFWVDYEVKLIEGERIVWNDQYEIAGTLDLFISAKVKNKRRRFITDIKSGKYIFKKHFIQNATYWKARTTEEKLRRVGSAILHLGVNKCGYSFKIDEDVKQHFKDWLTINAAHKVEYGEEAPKFYEFMPSYKLTKVK